MREVRGEWLDWFKLKGRCANHCVRAQVCRQSAEASGDRHSTSMDRCPMAMQMTGSEFGVNMNLTFQAGGGSVMNEFKNIILAHFWPFNTN